MGIENFDTIGDYLRHLRKEKGYSQEQLGEKIGTLGTHVSKWETNRNKITRHYALRLGEVFDVSPNNFDSFDSEKREKERQEKYRNKYTRGVNEEPEIPSPNHNHSADVEDLGDRLKNAINQQGFSGTDRAVLLEYLQERAGSLSEEMRQIQILLQRLIEMEKDHSGE